MRKTKTKKIFSKIGFFVSTFCQSKNTKLKKCYKKHKNKQKMLFNNIFYLKKLKKEKNQKQ